MEENHVQQQPNLAAVRSSSAAPAVIDQDRSTTESAGRRSSFDVARREGAQLQRADNSSLSGGGGSTKEHPFYRGVKLLEHRCVRNILQVGKTFSISQFLLHNNKLNLLSTLL